MNTTCNDTVCTLFCRKQHDCKSEMCIVFKISGSSVGLFTVGTLQYYYADLGTVLQTHSMQILRTEQ